MGGGEGGGAALLALYNWKHIAIFDRESRKRRVLSTERRSQHKKLVPLALTAPFGDPKGKRIATTPSSP